MGDQQAMSSNMLRTVVSQGGSTQWGAMRKENWIYLWHVLLETWTELGELMQEEDTYNSLNMSKNVERIQPKTSRGSQFPRCNNANIDLYVIQLIVMPTDPCLVNPKVEMLP